MSLMKTLFGSSDPLSKLQNQNPYLQQQVQAQYNQQIGMQQAMAGGGMQQAMAGGGMQQAMAGGGLQQAMAGGGMITAAMASAAEKQATEAFMRGYGASVQSKTREYIANEVQKMADEIGAPTLLHAVVLAIRTMEIPE